MSLVSARPARATPQRGSGLLADQAVSASRPTRIDRTPPQVDAPAAWLLDCGGSSTIPATDPRIVAWLGLATATDDCVLMSFVDDAPALIPCGCDPGTTTTITWTATDGCGMTASALSSVTAIRTASLVRGASIDGVLRVTRQAPGLRLSWQERAAAPTGHDVYSGTIAAPWASRSYDHAPLNCHLVRPPGAIDLSAAVAMPAGDSYFVVAPADCVVEGSVGADSFGRPRPIAGSGTPCGPMP